MKSKSENKLDQSQKHPSSERVESPRPALERDVIQMLLDLVGELADTGRCHYDHHGYCQEHTSFNSGMCPHGRAQSLFDEHGNPKPLQLIVERLKAQ